MNFAGYLKSYTLESWNHYANIEFEKRSNIAQKIADDYNLRLICVNSNISDLYQGAHLFSHTFRTCSVIFATQKMWSRYYFASAGLSRRFEPSVELGSASYDDFTLNCFVLKGLSFGVHQAGLSRLEKTKLLTHNVSAQKLLNVCSFHTENCGKCDKCIRTMLTLDILGALDDFSEAFKDQTTYIKNKWKYMGRVRFSNEKDDFLYEIKKYAQAHHIHYPWKTIFYPIYKMILEVYLKLKPKKRR